MNLFLLGDFFTQPFTVFNIYFKIFIMKKNLLVVSCLSILFYSCEKNDESAISLRAKNSSAEHINVFLVQWESLKYDDIGIGETTAYQSWEYGKTKPDTFEIRTDSATAGPFIYNYTPEGAKLEGGFYTMEIQDDAIVNFVKD